VLYWVLYVVQNIFLRIFYKFDFRGVENIPRKQPVVIATNHANAFIDPCIIGIMVPDKIRFFARGDIFKGKLAKRALESMNISPMYRMMEGYGEIKKNDKTFEQCRQLLADDKALLLFPEAICILERKLRPLKKGLSRIVFQTEENFDFKKNVWIVPAGINYTKANRFRSKVFVEFGKPMSLKDYEEKYKQDKVRTINEFTRALEERMKEHLVIVDDNDNEKVHEVIEELYTNEYLKTKKLSPSKLENQYEASKYFGAVVNYVAEHESPLLIDLKEKLIDYNRRVRGNELRDHLLRAENIHKMNFLKFVADFFVLWFGVPFYLFGLVTNALPYLLAKKFADNKVRHIEFYASVHSNLGMILWLVMYPLQLLLIALVFKSWLFLGVYALLVPVSGFFMVNYYPVMKKIIGRLRLLRMVRKERKLVEELINLREQSMQLIYEAENKYLQSKK
jgi:1-acyl-sn-glycerol-3-phosphate acyltransferase